MPEDSRTRLGARRPPRKIPVLTTRQGVCKDGRTDGRTAIHHGDFPPSQTTGAASGRCAQGGVFDDLAARLQRVRITCGDWSRVLTPSVTTRHGLTGVVLDPPYDGERHGVKYAVGGEVSADVRAWAIEHGNDPLLRIALCGYDGEHAMPAGWTVAAWKAQGGYGSQGQGRGRENAAKERIWFSPHCLSADQRSLLEASA